MTLLFVVLGTIFGFVLSRSGAADYNFIQSMFLFRSQDHSYLVDVLAD